jgi:phage terminase large subunit
MNLKATKIFEWNYTQLNKFKVVDEDDNTKYEGNYQSCKDFCNENFYSIDSIMSDKRFILNQGSSRSSKTYSLCQTLILFAMENPDMVISVVRKTFPSLRATIMRDFFGLMKEYNLYNSKYHNKTEHTYTFSNGTVVEFFSVDNEAKVRGRKRHIILINEANELWDEDFQQLNMRTELCVIADYNPSSNDCWLYDLPQNDTKLIKSTFRLNPFLPKGIVAELYALKDKDDALWTIFGLGERAITRENIFNNFNYLEHKPERFKNYIIGLDFGYVHPTAMVKVWYHEDEIFIEEMIYESYLTSTDIIERTKNLGVTYSETIIADYARPEIIAEMQAANFTILNADKSVKGGINDVKHFKIYTNSKNVWKEYENYRYKKIQGKVTEEPVKILDDTMDAIRYACRYIRKFLVNQGATFTIS